MKKRLKAWRYWAKHNMNGRFYKFLVLLGIAHSPTFGDGSMWAEIEDWDKEEQ